MADAAEIRKAIELLKANGFRWIRSAFVEVSSIMHEMIVPAGEYIEGNAFTVGLGFDGSSVRGFKVYRGIRHGPYAGCKTLAIIPWTTEGVAK